MGKIKLILTDCDGVLTDGGLFYDSDGKSFKRFYCKDGIAFGILNDLGIPTGVITGDPYTKSLTARQDRLKIRYLYFEVDNKLNLIKELAEKEGISLEEIAYIGDDINDLESLLAVGIGACPADAHHSFLEYEDILDLDSYGGRGVFREFVEYLVENNYV